MPGSTLAARGKRLPEGQVRAALTWSYVSFDRTFEGSDEVENGNGLHGYRHHVVAEIDAQVSSKVRVDLVIPAMDGEYNTLVNLEPVAFDRIGIGDVSATVVWHPWGDEPEREEFLSLSNLCFALGLKAPTGRVSRDGTNDGPVKLGTGSWDFILGAAYGGRLADFEFFASLFLTLNGPETEPETDAGEFLVNGPLWRARTGAVYSPWSWLSLTSSVDLEVRARNDLGDESLPNSGGTTLSLSPGVSVQPFGRLSIFAGVSIPVYRDVNLRQLVSEETWSVGASWTF